MNEAIGIVGVGASAGGLEAILELVKNTPSDVGAAYVVVQHLSPQHRSLLGTLISRETPLEVVELQEDSAPKPNTIYVTAPNHDVLYQNGELRLHPPSPELAAPKPSVDRFFVSIANELAERAVGVVLSGTGSDGSYGVQAIRAAGGVTIAQNSETAKYDGMPMAAVETGCVDLVLSPAQIGSHISRIMSMPRDFEDLKLSDPNDKPLGDLLQIVLARTRVDFREYKPSTIQRRIERRMTATGVTSLEAYTQHCRTNEGEVRALLKDLLISVTRFFRDPDEFAQLKEQLIRLARDKQDQPLRIWVAGCATGEEAYSIAILVAEAMGGLDKISKEKVQIFATDIDGNALKIARAGRYSLAATYDIPEDYVSKYFVRHEDGVRVAPALREIVLISMHNICQDPPFINLDLVCCRNMMIYFASSLQKKVLRRIHYALRQGGLLFVGTAESAAAAPEMFSGGVDGAHIYRKRLLTGEINPGFADAGGHRPQIAGRNAADRAASDMREQAERALFDALARAVGPDAILLSSDMRILRVYGDLSRYIALTEKTRLNMSAAMLRGPLATEARSLSALALRDGKRRSGAKHKLSADDDMTTQIEVLPLRGESLDDGATLLTFHRSAAAPAAPRETGAAGQAASERIKMLEHEVENTREALQQTVEELETSNEELQSVNEELQSTNEELQSSNEELETSNEELQSTNEELVTVNEELEVNANELQLVGDDLQSILANIPTPVVVVDVSLQITRASSSAMELFSIERPADKPHLSQAALPRGYPALPELCAECLRLGKPLVREFESESASITLRCAPFSDGRGRMAGVALVFMASDAAQRITRELDSFIAATPHLMMQRDRDGQVLRVSDAKARLLGKPRDQIIGRNYRELVDRDSAQRVLRHDRAFLDSDEPESIMEEEVRVNGERRWLMVDRLRHNETGDGEATIYTLETDITHDHIEGAKIDDATPLLRLMAQQFDCGWWSYNPNKNSFLMSEAACALFGVDPKEFIPTLTNLRALLEQEDQDRLDAALDAALAGDPPDVFTFRLAETGAQLRVALRPEGENGARRVLGVTTQVKKKQAAG